MRVGMKGRRGRGRSSLRVSAPLPFCIWSLGGDLRVGIKGRRGGGAVVVERGAHLL